MKAKAIIGVAPKLYRIVGFNSPPFPHPSVGPFVYPPPPCLHSPGRGRRPAGRVPVASGVAGLVSTRQVEQHGRTLWETLSPGRRGAPETPRGHPATTPTIADPSPHTSCKPFKHFYFLFWWGFLGERFSDSPPVSFGVCLGTGRCLPPPPGPPPAGAAAAASGVAVGRGHGEPGPGAREGHAPRLAQSAAPPRGPLLRRSGVVAHARQPPPPPRRPLPQCREYSLRNRIPP